MLVRRYKWGTPRSPELMHREGWAELRGAGRLSQRARPTPRTANQRSLEHSGRPLRVSALRTVKNETTPPGSSNHILHIFRDRMGSPMCACMRMDSTNNTGHRTPLRPRDSAHGGSSYFSVSVEGLREQFGRAVSHFQRSKKRGRPRKAHASTDASHNVVIFARLVEHVLSIGRITHYTLGPISP